MAEGLSEGTHELLLFKRMDSCHTFTFYGFEIDDGAEVLPLDVYKRQVVLLLIIFACTILQKLFFKYIFRDAESEDESYKAKRARLKAEKQAKKVGKGVA